MGRGFLSLVGEQAGPDSLRRVLKRGSGPHSDLATAADREDALRHYTALCDEEADDGSWWVPAVKLAVAQGLPRRGAAPGSPLWALPPALLERCAAELFCAGGATSSASGR
jgi:hypothetical protein